MPRTLPIGVQRDCRKHNSSARKEVHGVLFESRPRKGFEGQWVLVHGSDVSIRRKRMAEPWKLYLRNVHIGTDFFDLNEMFRSNMWAIEKGLFETKP